MAENTSRPLIVDHVPSELLAAPSVVEQKEPAQPAEKSAAHTNLLQQTPSITLLSIKTDRFVQFEREYGIHEQSINWVGRMLQTAKYQLDSLAFSTREAVRKLEFSYDIAGPSGSALGEPEYSLPLFGSFGKVQLKSVLSIHDSQTKAAFIGLKLSMRFGRGGSSM